MTNLQINNVLRRARTFIATLQGDGVELLRELNLMLSLISDQAAWERIKDVRDDVILVTKFKD